MIVASLLEPDKAFPALVLMGIGWFISMNVIGPRLMSDTIGIHPIVVLASALIGAKIAGIMGAIFGMPIAAVISAFFFHFSLARGKPARSPTARPRRRCTRGTGDVADRASRWRASTRTSRNRSKRPTSLPAARPAVRPNGWRVSAGLSEERGGRSNDGRQPTPRATSRHDRERARTERRDLDKERGEPLAGGAARKAAARAAADGAATGGLGDAPEILVTNDDGIESRGLLALKQALDPLGEVYVVAPDTNQSAVGHQKTLMRPLRVRERTLADGRPASPSTGRRRMRVSLALLGYFEIGFDLIASGINYGANLGDDITYSGTVSAAMEAVIYGCPDWRSRRSTTSIPTSRSPAMRHRGRREPP